MKTTGLLTTVTMVTLAMTSAVATAQAPKPPAGPSPAPVPGAATSSSSSSASATTAALPSPPGLPRPPVELDQIKWIEGNWRCDGKAPAGPMGPEHAYKSTMKVKRQLDGFWYATEYEQKKSKENPVAIKASSFLGFDPIAKKVVSVGVDNMGGALQLPGTIEGDKISTVGEGSMGGQKVGFKETITRAGDRALIWHGEVRMGKDWVVVGDETCKR